MCLESFIDWLPTNSVLYDHSAKRFDARFVMREMESLQLTPDFQEKCSGFVDPLPLLKNLYPDRKNFKQETLVNDLLGTEYQAHDSLADVMSLPALADVCCVSTRGNRKVRFFF